MAGFGKQYVFGGLRVQPLGHIFENQQDLCAVLIRMLQATSSDQHCAPPDPGKLVGDLIAVDCPGFRHDLGKEVAKLLYVPLPVAELEKGLPNDVVAFGLKGSEEAGICIDNAKGTVEDQQRLLQGVDDALCMHMAASKQAIEFFQSHVGPQVEITQRLALFPSSVTVSLLIPVHEAAPE